MKLFALLVTGFAISIACTGCTTKGKPPLVAECGRKMSGERTGPALVGLEYGRQATAIPLDSVQFSNWNVAKTIAVQRLAASRTPTDTVQITARFVSCSDKPVSLLVRTSFLDSSQAPAEPSSGWLPVLVQPRMTGLYSEYSTSKNVSNYLIEIMPGQ